VGGLDKGQNLHQLFTYLGIMDKLNIRKMDEDAFDTIVFDGDPVEYMYAQGYERFRKSLIDQFPEEEQAIVNYCNAIQEVCNKFPLYNLRTGSAQEKESVLETGAKDFIDGLTTNKKLCNVLAATNLLYAGEADKTPFYVHALVVNSYIESAWRFTDGGSQIGRLLAKEITSRGGKVVKHATVTRLIEEDGVMAAAEVNGRERYFAKTFISNIHPVRTLELTESDKIKKIYRERINELDNSMSCFMLNIVVKKNTIHYANRNFYFFSEEDVWGAVNYTPDTWPLTYALFQEPSRHNPAYTNSISIMTYMRFDEVARWKHTVNTVAEETQRGDDYEVFKKEKAEKLLAVVYKRFPELQNAIEAYYVSTPLTLRDYVGSPDGSLYGIAKDYRNPVKTTILPQTKIENLLLTGQNINLHGILGVTFSGVLACAQLLGMDYLIEKIRNA
jgi:all-trans-retinol 13,14-reductase